MDISDLMSAIEEVLSAQSEQELASILAKHPVLLEQGTIENLKEVEKQARKQGQEVGKTLQKVVGKIVTFQSQVLQQLPSIEPKVAWAIKARRHLALQKKELLDEAISEAAGQTEIVDFLRAFADGNNSEIDKFSKQLIPQLSVERLEEALTLKLLNLHILAYLSEIYLLFPVEQQKEVREFGIQNCQEAIRLAQILQDKPCQAFYSRMMALGFANSHQFLEAEYFYVQGLQLYRDCVLPESNIFLPDVAATLNNLGLVQSNQRKLAEAETSYVEALKIYQKLAETDPQIFLPDVGMTLNNLGTLQWELRNLAEAETYYTEALIIRRELAKTDPQTFLQDVATTLTNLGVAQNDQRKLAEAETSYIEALVIRRDLAETAPHIFLSDVAMTLMNLGITQKSQRKLAEAETACIEALEIYRKLAEAEPHIFLQGIAKTLNNLGNIDLEARKLTEAEIAYIEALEIYRKLAEAEPHIFLQGVAKTLNNLGQVQLETRKAAEAEISYIEALEIYRKLAETEPHIFLRDVAGTLDNLGALHQSQRKLTEAETACIEALEIYRKLAEAEPHIFLLDVGMTLNNLGNIDLEARKLAEAEIAYIEALEIYRKLAETEPHIFLQGVAAMVNNLGNTQKSQRKLAEAETSYIEALEIYRKLAETDSHIFLPDVGMTLNNLGNVQLETGKLAETEISYTEALVIRRDLALQEPRIFTQDVAITLNNLGYLQLEQHKFDEAKKYFEASRTFIEDIRSKAITIDDRNRILQSMSSTYRNLLVCYIRMKDWEKALEIAELSKSRSLTDLLNLKSEELQPKAPSSDTSIVVKDLGIKYSDAIKKLQLFESHERYLSEQLSQFEQTIRQIKNDNPIPQASLQQITEQKQLVEGEKQKVQNQRFAVQAELKRVLDEISKYDRDFPPKAKDIDVESIFAISNKQNRTIVMFRLLNKSTAIIFIFPNSKLQIEEIQGFGQGEAYDLFYDKWLIPYEQWKKSPHQPPNLKDATFQISQSPGNEFKEFKDWTILIEQTLETLYEKLIIHVHQFLREKSPTKDILFIPSQSLALLPLHAASWKDANGEKHYLLEEFTISYCPSVSVFKRCQENEKHRSNKTLFVTDPTRDLISSAEEVEFIKNLYQPSENLYGEKATKALVINALRDDYSFIHFSCHGFYYQDNQFESGLRMAEGQITLSEIINCNLKNNWLTTLSACETGMVDFASPTDEHFGLPLGFIFAGSPSIWASLWSVSDEATSLLMKLAYENLSKKEFQNNKPEALRQAQLSLRKKFLHPYFWAGFQHFGI